VGGALACSQQTSQSPGFSTPTSAEDSGAPAAMDATAAADSSPGGGFADGGSSGSGGSSDATLGDDGASAADTSGAGAGDATYDDAPWGTPLPPWDGSGPVVSDSGPPPACTGLQCQAVNCAGMGQPETSLTGTVRDPAGALPLYNIYVYVPNTMPDPITPGHPTCTPCEAPASGHPVIGALTDASGKFTIQKGAASAWGVPAGQNIPIVLQAGKWRRQLVIPQVTPCAGNNLDTLLGPDKMRLPKNSSEGDMPLIAFTSGCDPAECFLRHIGIADSEFVPPGSPKGHVQFYTGQDVGLSGSASMVTGGNTFQNTYQWWTSAANLANYDIVFNACECNPNDRNMYATGGASAYTAIDTYLNGGGRVFSTHYYYNWFAPPTGGADLQSVAQWTPGGFVGGGAEMDTIDMTFPKGQAFAQWLQNNAVTTTLGNVTLYDTRDDVTALAPAGCSTANATCLSTQWIVHPGDNHPRYISFNTPVSSAPEMQCGRAVFSDVHLSGASDDTVFPAECAVSDPNYAVNEKALEFLFFDLSSCIQPPNVPPPVPTRRE
jgi:hypothetical protein